MHSYTTVPLSENVQNDYSTDIAHKKKGITSASTMCVCTRRLIHGDGENRLTVDGWHVPLTAWRRDQSVVWRCLTATRASPGASAAAAAASSDSCEHC